MSQVVLITGFEPFDQASINPSWEVARALEGWQVAAGVQVRAVRLPTAFEAAPAVLRRALQSHRPALVIALGLASGRAELSIERVAVNLIDARIPDNAGQRPQDCPVQTDAPAAYFSTLPIKAMVAAVRAAGYPAGLSLSAGAFVCNQVFFELQHALAGSGVPSGFIHLPALPEQAAEAAQANLPSMALVVQIEAMRVAVKEAWAPRALAGPGEGAPTS
jgi:pyroglutamyl-peptidase